MLGADGDDDLVGRGPDAAARQDLGLHLLDEAVVVARDVIGCPHADVQHAQGLEAALAPGGRGKQVLVELAVEKWIGKPLPVVFLDDAALLAGTQPQAARPVGMRLGVRAPGASRRAFGRAALQHVGMDEMAFSLAAQQEGLLGQLLVGHDHGDAAHAQQLGQLATRWNGVARRENAGQDGIDQHLANLTLKAQGGPGTAAKQLLPHVHGWRNGRRCRLSVCRH